MNLIRKKAQSGLGVIANSQDAFAPWIDMHTSLCDYLSKYVGCEVLPGTNSVDTGVFKSLRNDMPEDLICFGFGDSLEKNVCIAAIEPSVAKMFTDKQLGILGGDKKPKDLAANVGLLDLFLMKPCAEIILDGLNTHILSLADSEQHVALRNTSETLGLSDYEIENKSGDWIRVSLVLDMVEQSTEPEKGNKSKSKKAASKDTASKQDNYSIHIFMPKKLLEAITAAQADDEMAPDFDPNEPWAIHMRNAAEGAEISLKAVLETCNMSVAECTRLSIGQVIALPGVTLQSIALETNTESGVAELALAELGTYKANRALQLSEGISPAFVSDLDTIII